ncbi:hypothetical protein V9Z28_10005 [Streptococcus suis]|uniref:hypothetical protein n=1 Tax=Streptococcus suis TaxID=1307 RepID=UPI000406225F|nr:hypothetical protein [Streptococcus suis]QZS61855.1 hypothetical protein K6972_05055 [Streptococcus suis]HEL9598263.1 hypothetical protein [Streptococcus suis]
MNPEKIPYINVSQYSNIDDLVTTVVQFYGFIEGEKVMFKLLEEVMLVYIVSLIEKKRIRAPDRYAEKQLTPLEKLMIRFVIQFLIDLTKNIF